MRQKCNILWMAFSHMFCISERTYKAVYWLLGTSVQKKTDLACPIALFPWHGTRLRDKGSLFFSLDGARTLICSQLQVAVRTPFAAVEANDHWTLHEQVRERHCVAQRIRQREIRDLRPLPQDLLNRTGDDKLFDWTQQVL